MTKKLISFHVLGLKQGATEAEIKSAYKRKAVILHPDKHGNSEVAKQMFQDLQDAYTFLISDFIKHNLDFMFN